jgi:hypothetical protein
MPLVVVAALLLVLAVSAPAAQAKGPMDVGCGWSGGERTTGPSGDRSSDVVRGALTLFSARALQRHRIPLARTGHAPLDAMLEAGHEATLVLAPESREIARLVYVVHGHRLLEDIQMQFRGCDPRTARRSDGSRPRTLWPGGLRIRRPGCARLHVWVDGRQLDDVRIPLGRPCRPPAPVPAVGCEQRSMASFPNAYRDPRNIVVGPVAIVEGGQAGKASSAAIIADIGWWKSPMLLRAGEEAVLSVAWESRDVATLTFGSAEGRAIRFVACSAEERSGSDADGHPVTFWSGGFVPRRVPGCVGLDLWIGDAPARRLRVPFGSPSACS